MTVFEQDPNGAVRPHVQHASATEAEAAHIGLRETLRIAAHALWANKLRTLLTALGVIIGVAAVVALLSIGRGTQQQITERITANGANLLTVRATEAVSGGSATLTNADAEALADPINLPGAALVSPEYSDMATLVAGSQSKTTIVQGVTAAYFTIHNSKLALGEFLGDSHASQSVAVLGARLAGDLFGDTDPIGQSVRVKGQRFRVIGVLGAKGAGSLGFDDDAMFVPLAVAQRKLFGERVGAAGGKAALSTIVVQARDKDQIEPVRAQIAALLRERHRVPADGTADDFTIDNQQDLIETLTETSRTMTLYLGAIAAISLLVGGIGIMNIMLVGVRERTREIGLRKAIGARERDILMQFLIESLVLSLGGGVLGLLIGVSIALGADATGRSRAIIIPGSLLLAVGFASIIGLFFGIEPARRAARLDPIEALRSE